MCKFKLGLDFHGVIDSIPETLVFLSKAVVDAGGECHVLTGNTIDDEFLTKLKDIGISYTHLFSIFDHHQKLGTPVVGWHERFKIPTIDNVIWDKTKAEYCKEHSISLHIDDTMIYNQYFETPFARLWTHNNKCKGDHKDERHLL